MENEQTVTEAVKEATTPAKKGSYNPYKIRRRVRRDQEGTTPELEAFKTKSFTKKTDDLVYHPTVDAAAGRAFCDCYHAVNTLRASFINKPATCCKHTLRAIAQMEATGELAPLEARLAEEKAAAAKIATDYLAFFDEC